MGTSDCRDFDLLMLDDISSNMTFSLKPYKDLKYESPLVTCSTPEAVHFFIGIFVVFVALVAVSVLYSAYFSYPTVRRDFYRAFCGPTPIQPQEKRDLRSIMLQRHLIARRLRELASSSSPSSGNSSYTPAQRNDEDFPPLQLRKG